MSDIYNCDEIIPGIWLGGRRAVSIANFERLQIDLVITLMSEEDIEHYGIDSVMKDASEDLGVSWIQCECEDTPEEDISGYFQDISDILTQCIHGGKKVLIHCLGGISRSPTLVCAYLIQSCEIGWKQALTFVQGKRSCIDPNIGFLLQLEEWDTILHEKKEVIE